MTTRRDVIAEARTWVGTRWAHQGYLKRVGCDCIGLVAGVALALGLPEARDWASRPEYHQYSPIPDARLLLAGCAEFLDRIPIAEARTADVLMLKFRNEPTHFALISSLGPPMYVLHALSRAERVVEHRFSALLNGQVVRAYRYRGVDG